MQNIKKLFKKNYNFNNKLINLKKIAKSLEENFLNEKN